MKRAVFLDRDGTITKSDGYFSSYEKIELLGNLSGAIKLLNRDFLVIIITNQPVVARGMCTEEDVRKTHGKIIKDLEKQGARIDGVYFCPHHPEHHDDVPEHARKYRVQCKCRKPETELIEQAVEDFGIDVRNSFFIGDSTRDIKTAKNAGCTSILVRTGLAGNDKKYDVEPDYTCNDILEASKLVNELINVRAVLLAGGKGERLRPLTLNTPKPLLEIAGKSILEHQMDALKRSGINKIVLCASYLSDKIKDRFGDGSRFSVSIEYPEEPEMLGSGGAVKNAKAFLDDASYLIIINGDSMVDGKFDFRELVKFHVNASAFATLLVRETDHPLDSDVLRIDENGRILEFIGRGQEECKIANSGMTVCSPKLLDCIPDGNCNIEKDVLFKLIEKKDLYGFKMPNSWFKRDIGTLERLESVRKYFD
ncbi:MAG: HAD-IIIA family hydrolase [Candidatus Aenigmarchaeota archaeon]|nr:HAD-IIIA family hydrolase [Candidatus Aenigmarchaeota archaeon]